MDGQRNSLLSSQRRGVLHLPARILRALTVVLAGTLLGGCFDLSLQLELRANGSGQVGMAVITTPAVAPAFRDMPPAPGAEIRESIAGGKYHRSEVVAFTSLASLQLPRQRFHLARTAPNTTTITHTIRIEGNPVAALMLRGHVFRYEFTTSDLGASSWSARLGGIEITPVITGRTIVWEVPLELLASQREQDLVVKLDIPSPPSSAVEVAQPQAPAPTLTSIAPDPVPGLDGRQTVTLNGSGFVDGTRVMLRTGGQTFAIPAERTTVVNPNVLSVSVNLTTRSSEWTAEVVNPDSRASNRLAFRVDPCPGGIEVSGASAPGNVFDRPDLRGFCTWYAAERWLQSGNRRLPSIRSARFWAEDARKNGFWVDAEQPTKGSIMVVAGTAAVPDGHVAYVERIEADGLRFTVTEMNFGRLGLAQDERTTCFNRVTRRTLSAKEVRGLIGFIYPEQSSNTQYAGLVTRLFQEVLHRAPDAVERARYVGLLKQGVSESELRATLGRAPDVPLALGTINSLRIEVSADVLQSNGVAKPTSLPLSVATPPDFCSIPSDSADGEFLRALPDASDYLRRTAQLGNATQDVLKAITWGEYQGTPIWKAVTLMITVDGLLRTSHDPVDTLDHESLLLDLGLFTTTWTFTKALSSVGLPGVAAWANLAVLPITESLKRFSGAVEGTALQNQLKLYLKARAAGCSADSIRERRDDCASATLSFYDAGWLQAVAAGGGTSTCDRRACIPRPLKPAEVFDYGERLWLRPFERVNSAYRKDRDGVIAEVKKRLGLCASSESFRIGGSRP